jgi:AcrR family transcriptional regulator
MSTEKLDTEIRKEQIAQAALSLVASQGLRAVTVGRVAKLIGLVPSALYRHFKNKDQIIDAVLDLLESRLTNNLANVDEAEDPIDALRKLLMRHVQLILEYQAVPRILFSDEVFSGRPERKGRLYGIITRFLNGVAAIIRHGQEGGRIRRDRKAETLATMFIGLFQPAVFLWHLSNGKFDMIRHVDLAWEMFADAITDHDSANKESNSPEVNHHDEK